MSLTIYGVLGDDLWIDRDGYTYPFWLTDLARARNIVATDEQFTDRVGNLWDESQVCELVAALPTARELDPCVRCRELPILHGGDHCIECAGLAQAKSDEITHIRNAS